MGTNIRIFTKSIFIAVILLSGRVPGCSGCSAPGDVPDASYTPTAGSYVATDTVTYTCNTGYEYNTGDLVRTCDGTNWNGSAPSCTIKTCAAVAVANASPASNQATYDYNTDVTYLCDVGYEHASGNLVRTCTASATWDGVSPVCTIKTCALVAVANASPASNQATYDYNTAVTYTCDVGYEQASGDLVRTCTASATWSGVTPVCTIKQCASVSVSNASPASNQAKYDYNTAVTYTCDVGYEHASGNLVQTCTASATWSGVTPVCTIKTCASVAVANASPASNQVTYDYNTAVTYTCDVGYEHTGGNLVRTCTASGTWDGVTPVCTIKTCASVAVANASPASNQAAYDYNTAVTYTCDVGYEHASGNLVRTCTASETWDGVTPVCTIKTCSPVTVSNASPATNQPTYDYNTAVTYTCDVGYEHTGGNLVRTCTASATWSGVTPVCTIKTCASVAVVNASPDSNQATYDYNTAVTYTCDVGYEHESGCLVRTCTASATWSGVTPVCTIKTCASVAVANASTASNQAAYDYNTAVTYTCDVGYEHTGGNLVQTCTASATWSGVTPVCTIKTCAPVAVANASPAWNQATYDYNTAVTYTCDVGYEHASGNLVRTCTASATWSGVTPVCTIKTCASVAVANASPAPVQAIYDYNTAVTYTCDVGYEHTGGNLVRTCTASATWDGVTPVCTIKTCASVAVANASPASNQATYDYNTDVTYTCDVGYEHESGNLVRTCTASGTWDGMAAVCTIKTCASVAVANASPASNQPTYDYNTAVTYTCDVGYEHTSGNLVRTCTASGTWDGMAAVCTIKTCASVAVANASPAPNQTTYDYNTAVTYTCDVGYEHSSGNLERTCTASATWSGVTPVCTIKTCAAVTVAKASRAPDQTTYDYNTAVTYTCDVGYELTSGDLVRTCTASGTWDGMAAVCTIKTCASVAVANASPTPTQPTYDYNTAVTYTCDVGYEHESGNLVRTCTASAAWDGVAPVCKIKTCAVVVVANASPAPDQTTYDYNTAVTYTCDVGYEHASGNLVRTCTASATWSEVAPVCQIKTCAYVAVANASRAPNQPTYDYNTVVTYTCDVGYEQASGNLVRTCTPSTTWSGVIPVCTIKTCASAAVANASPAPVQTTYDYNTAVTYTCDVGYEHESGNLVRTCTASSTWDGVIPVCTIKTCAAVAIANAYPAPNQAIHNYNTDVTYTCDLGYEHTSGNLVRTCTASATWSGVIPVCTIKTCASVAVANASPAPNQTTYDYNTAVTYTCDVGYEHASGNLARTCTAIATWDGVVPVCTIKTCTSAAVANASPASNQATYDYNTAVTYTCDVGYEHESGNLVRTCTASATWDGVTPVCTIKTCASVDVANASPAPNQTTYDYNTAVTYTCDVGYEHASGNLIRTCTASATWNATTPVCTIKTCASVAVANASPAPNQPTYDYNTDVTYTCDVGYEHTSGNLERTCTASSTWDGVSPVCIIKTCASVAVANASPAPIQLTYDYNTTVTYTCDVGYEHASGNLVRTCTASATWNGTTPICTIKTCVAVAVANASRAPNQPTYDYNTAVTYTCDVGYEHTSGDLVRTCTASSTWGGVSPVCTIKTCASVVVANASPAPNQATYDYNTAVTYTCDVGYEHTSGNLVRTCTAGATLDGVSPVCTIKTCAAVAVANASPAPDQSTHDYNTAVTYTCDVGYEHASGNLVRTCTASATWDGVTPVCTMITCASVAVANASPAPAQPIYEYNTVVTYTCDVGYEHTSGNLSRTCTASSTWDGVAPICPIKTCASVAVANASAAPNQATHNYNTAVTYTCDVGYEHESGNLVRTCTASATWDGTTPVCTIKQCALITVANAYPAANQVKYDYNTAVTYTCDVGYERTSGNLVRTCTASATWDGDSPVCTMITCASVAVANASPASNQATYDYNTAVTYTCDVGYEHTSGNLVRTCTASATWSGVTPVCTIKTCSLVSVANTTPTPNRATYDYNTAVTYTCDVGYEHASGTLVRTCTASATWDGVSPVCTIKTCAFVAVANAHHAPVQTTFDYNTAVTYTCDVGYELASGNLVRTCTASATWSGVIPVCTMITCAAASVANASPAPVQATHDYNTAVTYTCDVGYEHTSGNLVRTCTASATWDGAAPVCSIKTCASVAVANASATSNQPTYDYNTAVTYTCDVGYEHASGNLVRTCTASATWDGVAPVCIIQNCTSIDVTHSTRTPHQSLYNYGTSVTYTCDATYERTSGDLNRACLAASIWSGTTPVCSLIKCTPDVVPESTKSPNQAEYDYNTSVTYACVVGYELTSGTLARTCQADKTWTGTTPVCTIKTCSAPEDVFMATKNPDTASYDYNTDVTYTCVTGWERTSGDAVRTCSAATTWTGSAPTCIIKTCAAPAAVSHASVTPDAPQYNYSVPITYSCDVGYEQTSGDLVRTCQDSKSFNGQAPVCTIKTCATEDVQFADKSPSNLAHHDYNTDITYTCHLAYNHTAGDLVRTCDSNAQWTGTLPTCSVAACLPPSSITLGSYLPVEITYEFYTQLTYTCTLGYYVSAGDAVRTCQNTGLWNGTSPTCSLVRCSPPGDIANSAYLPTKALYDYNTGVTYTCDLSYNHTDGNLTRTCKEDFSWSGSAPVCTVAACIHQNSTYMVTNPGYQLLHEFDTVLIYSCILGYNHSTGDLARTCGKNTGVWSGTLPECVIVTCSQPIIPPHTSVNPDTPESNYNTDITYTCDLGYNRTGGDATRTCNETGEWGGTEANCTVIKCPPPDTIVKGTFSPNQAIYNYSDTVTYTCDFGYMHGTGDVTRTCTELTTWTGVIPKCPIVTCPNQPEAFSTMSPDTPTYDFNTTVSYTCILGYNRTDGDADRTCQHTGSWGGSAPDCTIVTCSQPIIPPYTSVAPDIPESNYNTDITYTCDLGFNRTGGDETRTCNETGEWGGTEANCTLVTCVPPPDIARATYSPVLAKYNYSNIISYECDFGWYKHSGYLNHTCTEHATWSQTLPVCKIVKCAKLLVPHASRLPHTATYNFNTTVTYTCDLGYNRTVGDATRTCQNTATWGGTTPSCTIVECDPPALVEYSELTPVQSIYVYQDIITYSCHLGYEMTSGDASRQCTETKAWTGTAPNCTIIRCPSPPTGDFNTYAPIQAEYVWNDTVAYSCNVGYNHSTGDLGRACLHDKTWSGTTPDCIIVTCNKIDVPFMTFSPPTAATHDFNITIEYECVLGYNHSWGDLQRTCNYTGLWTGILPNCTIITCDPPAAIAHTFYVPVQVEHDWNTSIDYSCNPYYHYVSGINKTTCNESGAFPPVDFDCSVLHTLTLNAAEPTLTWMNTTTNQTSVIFDFDGECDVVVTCHPPLLDVGHDRVGPRLTVYINDTSATVFDTYTVRLAPFRIGRTFQTLSRTVFYGEEILGLQASLNHTINTIEVGRSYDYTVYASNGTNVTLSTHFIPSTATSNSFPGRFSTETLQYIYTTPGEYNISFEASNLIGSQTVYVSVIVIYGINSVSLNLNSLLLDTTQPVVFDLTFSATALLPMSEVNITFDPKNGPILNHTHEFPIGETMPVVYSHTKTYPLQGVYNVTAYVENLIDSMTLVKTLRVWDDITGVQLSCQSICNHLITNTTKMEVQYINTPPSGFEFSIDVGDGTNFTSTGDAILYKPYNLSTFEHVYEVPGHYTVKWSATNDEYSASNQFIAIVENEVLDVQGWINKAINYLEVTVSHQFQVNASQGTDVMVDWKMEENVTISNTFSGEFVTATKDYIFYDDGSYNVTITARNLVSSLTVYVPVIVIYPVNNIIFFVDYTLANTTKNSLFYFKVKPDANISMDSVNFTIDYTHGTPVAETEMLDDSLPIPKFYYHNHLFDVQGVYTVTAKAVNIFGSETMTKVVNVWDTLDPLDFVVLNGSGKYPTNTTAHFEFINVPNAGFEYLIDYGDGHTNGSTSDAILYSLYNLTHFSHVYTSAGIYTLTWKAWNGAYTRTETYTVLVQNRVPYDGYVVEPVNKKYPWINLQTMPIPVNITLNDTVAIPTNATCVFVPDDGKPIVTNLTYNSRSFVHDHSFTTEGLFHPQLNCSNEVSYYVYNASLDVVKYNASFLDVVFEPLVPLNVSDTVIVYFHIKSGGFELIPLQVSLTWDFGDGSSSRRRKRSVAQNVYDMDMYQHTYSNRGDYTITLIVNANVTSTTNTLTYPIRLGIMHFENSGTVAYINTTFTNYTLYGVLGSSITYTLIYNDTTTDGVCTATDASGCYLQHYCPYYGYKLVTAIASNGSFVEVDNINITCDNPIIDLTMVTPPQVAIPDGVINLQLEIKQTDLFLPKLECRLSMGDPIKRNLYRSDQEVTFASPFLFTFQYIALGKHTIDVYCWNLINTTAHLDTIIVTNKDFRFTGVFDRIYSQPESPMLISSMRDTEIFSRLDILADHTAKTHGNDWQLNATVGEGRDRQGLQFMAGTVAELQYLIYLKVYFKDEPNNFIIEPTYVKLVAPPAHAEIVGSSRRIANEGSATIEFDAATLSYDPVHPQTALTVYSWDCKWYTANSFDDAASKHSSGSGASNCTYSNIGTGRISVNHGGETHTSYKYFAVTVEVTDSRGNTSLFTQLANVRSNMDLNIRCTINCLSKVAVTSQTQLVADVDNNCPAQYTWKAYVFTGGTYQQITDLKNITEFDASSPFFTFKANSLTPGVRYMVYLHVFRNPINYGPAYYEFVANQPPRGGTCKIIPYDDQTFKDLDPLPQSGEYTTSTANQQFNITCSYWQDEGFTDNTFTDQQPLFYYFFLSYSNDDTQKQILYFDPGSTSNLVTLRSGDPADEYRAKIVIRIVDVIGDYAEIEYRFKVIPTLTTAHLAAESSMSKQLEILKEFIERYESDIIKANRTWDYRTLSRKIMGVTSVYNALLLNTSNQVTLTPEDLLTLGYKRTEEGDLISWSEYWTLIVEVVDTTLSDYLIQTGEKYVSALHSSVATWPEAKRISIVAIETISRALNATMAKTEYSNVTAAVMSSKSVDILTKNLAEHVDDRTFPNTEQVLSAAIGIRDLIRGILAALQTVLTPNLPEDPTVDEMRNFLEYMKLFKTSEEVLSEGLSLQEQTFLAQKQLQKYYLQKYIKSEASKEALPHVTDALRKMAYILGKLSWIGQPENYLENDFVHVSSEIRPATEVRNSDIKRPRVTLEVTGLKLTTTTPCNATSVYIRSIIFKHNPYFWGTWSDRLTSYVPVFELEGAQLDSEKVTYRLTNKVTPECRDATPTYFENDPDKMIYILFDRQYGADDILLFIRPNATELVYEVYFNIDEKPSVLDKKYIYSTNIKTDKWTHEDGYKLLIKSEDFAATGKIWIALRPLLEDSSDTSLLTRHFCANVTSLKCLAWQYDETLNEYSWNKDTCKVSRTSSRAETVCECNSPTDGSIPTVATTFYVPPNKIDFLSETETLLPTGRMPVIGIVAATFIAYILLLVWAWREDVKDQYKWSFSLLIDNDIADSYFYILRVYTGMRAGAGTSSNIGFVLCGETQDTGIRILDDTSHVGFERGSVRTFIMSTRRNLGDLICVRIWHDDSGGNNASWYLNKITVLDMQTDKRYIFGCEQWFDFDHGDNHVDRLLGAAPVDDTRTFYDMATYTIAESHLWLSVFTLPLRSNFSRVQRLSCLMGLTYLTMIMCTMVIKLPDPNTDSGMEQAIIGPFRFSMDNFEASLISVSVASIIILIVAFFFKNSECEGKVNDPNSFARRTYRKANSYVKLDKSVLKTDFESPADEAMFYNFHFLPHFCVYVGWTILVCAVGGVTYLLLAFSGSWKLVRSEEWMTAVFCAFFISFIILETLRIIIILLFYALVCNMRYEPPEPSMDVDTIKEITKRNSSSLAVGPDFGTRLRIPVVPDQATLLKNKIKRINNHQLLQIFYQLVCFSGLLYIVYTISYESRDPRSFYMKNHIENMFSFHTSVTDMESYSDWLKGRFVNTYFSGTFFGAKYDSHDMKIFAEDLTNIRIGPARLRQLRIGPDDCEGPLGVNQTCYNRFVNSKAETSNYCLGWTPLPCDVTQKSNFFTSPAWLYNSSDEVWGFTTIATYGTYGGGGYFMKLDVNKDVCVKIFDELNTFNWFNRQTRAVILEFTIYNANANLFAYTKYVAEFPEVGGVLPYWDIQVFRLYSRSGPQETYILFLEFAFLLCVVLATLKFTYDIFTDARAFVKSVWNILDAIALLMAYITISMFIYKIYVIQKTISIFHADKNAYVGFENLAFYDFVVNTSHGVLVFLLSIRVSRILGYSGKINEMADVITRSADDLLGFLIIFSITYFAYVVYGTLLFGKETEKYRDLFQTYGTLTEAVVGKNRLNNILVSKPGFAEFYYFSFVLFVLLTLATMAAAILNFSISHVKKEYQKLAPANIVEVIIARVVGVFELLAPSRKQDTDGSKKQRRDSDTQLDDILSDLRFFIRTMRSNKEGVQFGKGPDKYRALTPEDAT